MYYPLAGLQFGKGTEPMNIAQLIPGFNPKKKLTIVTPDDGKKDIPVSMPTIDAVDALGLAKITNQTGNDPEKSIFSFPHILPLGVTPSKLRVLEADQFNGGVTVEGLPEEMRKALFPTTIVVPSPIKDEQDVPNNESDSMVGRVIRFLA